MNRLVTPLLHYVDIRLYEASGKVIQFSEIDTKESKSDAKSNISDADRELKLALQAFDDKSLSYIVHQLKGLFFFSTKKSVFDALLTQGTPQQPQQPGYPPSTQNIRVDINRIKASRVKENKGKDPNGMKTVFGQLFTQLKTTRPEQLRGKKNQQMFNVAFLGEGSIDVGGPYRECLTNVCAELMSDVIPLFLPCPNRKNEVGLGRDRWIINPGCTSSLHLEMYTFVGVLMGLALRTSFSLNLDLPSFAWKQLLGEKAEVSDLEAIDKLFIQALGELRKLTREKFEYMVEQKFTTQLSNGKETELKKEGKAIDVNFDNREEFFKLSIDTRLHEADQQIRAMKKGLNSVVPANMLSLFSWYDLELMVCGTPEVDVELLRKHTRYVNVDASSNLVKYFWQTMESFNSEERQMFLRFVWGRSRLPVSESDWPSQFTINPLNAGDDKLPISHTCFFSIDLPNYSSFEVMRTKLLFSIYNCTAIDVDFNPTDSSLNAWVESD
jgi:E3 ubiquitin-protein ligase HERC2